MSQITVRQRGDVQLDSRLVAQIHELGTSASTLLDRAVPSAGGRDAASAKQLLAWIWDNTMTELGVPTSVSAPARLGRLTQMLARVRELEGLVDDARLDASVDVMRRVRRALGSLDDVSTLDQLLMRAGEEACSLGFDRVAVSTVDDTRWNMHTMIIDKDPRLAEEMLVAGKEAPPLLDGSIVESDVVDRARASLVLDVQENPRVNRPLVSLSRCTSYGVAPLICDGKVVGLIHGDYHYPQREVDATDVAMLSLFANGVSQSVGRVSVLEGVASLRDGIARLMGGAPMRYADDPSGRVASPTTTPLSAREIEVIELMAAGRGNQAISHELSISEGTVKTHITHILRKLEANNRAEAVAYWLRR